jgi:hypothetical protein
LLSLLLLWVEILWNLLLLLWVEIEGYLLLMSSLSEALLVVSGLSLSVVD